MSPTTGRHFLQIPGPTNVPDRVLRAMSAPTIDHRGPEFAALGREVLDGARAGLRHHRPGGRLPGSGHRRVGGGAGQHALPRRPVLVFETGHFATLWQAMATRARAARSSWSPATGATASTRPPSAERLAADTGPRDQGRLRGAQRDLDRRDQPGARGARGHRRGRSPGAAAGRHDLLAGLDRLPPRRVGRRRHRRPARRRG